jgi:single-strand DNA-binding protein
MNELDNECRFTGNLGKDPELQYLPTGTAKATFSLAVDRTRKGQYGEYQNETTWVDFTAMGKTAENIVKLCQKGTKLAVSAEYQKDRYQNKEGENRVAHVFFIRQFSVLAKGKSRSESKAGGDEGDYGGSGYDEGDFPF